MTRKLFACACVAMILFMIFQVGYQCGRSAGMQQGDESLKHLQENWERIERRRSADPSMYQYAGPVE